MGEFGASANDIIVGMLSNTEHPPRFFHRLAFWLAALATFVFTISVASWAVFAWQWRLTAEDFVAYGYVLPAARCLALWLASVVCVFIAVKWPRAARWWVTALYTSALAFFCFDLATGGHQIIVTIATKRYWAAGDAAHHYMTWWWYNDRWMYHPIFKFAWKAALLAAVAVIVWLFWTRSRRSSHDKSLIVLCAVLIRANLL